MVQIKWDYYKEGHHVGNHSVDVLALLFFIDLLSYPYRYS